MIKVLIADDHAVVRRGLRQIMLDEGGSFVIEEATSGQEALRKLHEAQWDVMVLDVSLPDRNGLDLLQEVKQMCPKLPILMLSVHPESQYGLRALRAGASGYLNKESAPEELIQAITKVVGGSRYISLSLAETLAATMIGDVERQPHEWLSNREFTVFLRIGSGKSVSEIADELSLSVKTVSTYRTRILEKMHFTSNAEIIRYVIDHQLG
jgi:DNA-binding NarL/FixJ family response regulator